MNGEIKMKKRYILFIFALSFLLSVNIVSATDYFFEGHDLRDDVFEVGDEENFSNDHSFIDITFAGVFDKGENINFTIMAKGFISDNNGVSYNFLINSSKGNQFKIVYSQGIATFNNYLNCQNKSKNETIIISVPKNVLANIDLPWKVSVYTKYFGNFRDELDLEEIDFDINDYINDGSDDSNEDENDGSDDSNKDENEEADDKSDSKTPGFQLIILFISLFTFIIIKKFKDKI